MLKKLKRNLRHNFMAYILFRWIINAVALIVIANVVPGFGVETFYNALIAALILGLVNALVRPLFFILTLPVTILTLGLFTFVINALMIWLASTIVEGFIVEGFVPALFAALLLWVISLATNWLIKQTKES
jgi:putative membrane protein